MAAEQRAGKSASGFVRPLGSHQRLSFGENPENFTCGKRLAAAKQMKLIHGWLPIETGNFKNLNEI